MNAASNTRGGWSRRRFWGVVAGLFVAQAGLIMVFGRINAPAAKLSVEPTRFCLLDGPMDADELSRLFFATDPTVFSLPSLHGFSGRSWLTASPKFELPDQTEEPAWLGLRVDKLGTNFPSLSQSRSQLPAGLGQVTVTTPEPWPVFLQPETFVTNSIFEIRGELAGRKLNTPVHLRSWPSAQLLRKTVVQIAVNSAGQVVSARLNEPRSGLAEADASALKIARDLRFRPVPSSSPVWGEAVFEWETVEPAGTAAGGAP
jgi:hypothetical protein